MNAKRIKVNRDSGKLDIEYTWRSAMAYGLLFFCVIWDLFIVMFLLFGAGWFIIIHLLVGVLLTYYTFTLLLNKTNIKADGRDLTVSHGPLPSFSKDQSIPARSVRQLFLARGGTQKSGSKTTVLWNLRAELDTGAEVDLIKSIDDKEVARGLEQTIEGFLGIRNDPSREAEENKLVLPDLTRFKELLPAGIRGRVENLEQRARAEMQSQAGSTGGDAGAGSFTRTSGPLPGVGPNPLPPPHDTYNFNLYLAGEGERFRIVETPYKVGHNAQIDWEDHHQPVARQLEVIPEGNGERRYIYAELTRDRWLYYEERRLDDEEVKILGFEGELHPTRFNNGPDRYYPREQQVGRRFVAGGMREVEQFVYFTTRTTAQFRALRPLNSSNWEVYVQEPLDSAALENPV